MGFLAITLKRNILLNNAINKIYFPSHYLINNFCCSYYFFVPADSGSAEGKHFSMKKKNCGIPRRWINQLVFGVILVLYRKLHVTHQTASDISIKNVFVKIIFSTSLSLVINPINKAWNTLLSASLHKSFTNGVNYKRGGWEESIFYLYEVQVKWSFQ